MHLFPRFSLMLAAILTGLAGCSSYSPIAPAKEPVKIAVLPIANESDLPQIIAPLARNLREKLAHSPNWDLVDNSSAEALLSVTVLPMNKRPIARDPEDTGRPLSFYEEVRVSVEWQSELPCPWGQDNVIVISSDHILYAQAGLADARTSALPGLADRISEKILQQLDWSGMQKF